MLHGLQHFFEMRLAWVVVKLHQYFITHCKNIIIQFSNNNTISTWVMCCMYMMLPRGIKSGFSLIFSPPALVFTSCYASLTSHKTFGSMRMLSWGIPMLFVYILNHGSQYTPGKRCIFMKLMVIHIYSTWFASSSRVLVSSKSLPVLSNATKNSQYSRI